MSLWNYLLRAIGYGPNAHLTFDLDQRAFRALRRAADEEQRPPEELASDLLSNALARREAALENLHIWRTLTPRQREVCALVCLNYTSRQIAARLRISPETVKTHVYNALLKFNLRRRTELQKLLADWDFSAWD
ncbi:MAG: helix-turn-helix transcriptional regulator [Anaerolineales bacterium]|jgi:DNA-binding CsgD family transcriptional regulator